MTSANGELFKLLFGDLLMPERTERPVDGERFDGDKNILALFVGDGDFGEMGAAWPTEAVKSGAGEAGVREEDPGVAGAPRPFSGIAPAQL